MKTGLLSLRSALSPSHRASRTMKQSLGPTGRTGGVTTRGATGHVRPSKTAESDRWPARRAPDRMGIA